VKSSVIASGYSAQPVVSLLRRCVEQAATGAPLVYTYVLDPATGRYRDGEIFTGVVKLAAPFFIEIDLSQI
jgi:hypothetical protein